MVFNMNEFNLNELYEVMLNIRTIFESLSKEEYLAVCYLISVNTFFLLFGPKIVFWIIRVFKRLIGFIIYLYNLYKTKLKSILRKDD